MAILFASLCVCRIIFQFAFKIVIWYPFLHCKQCIMSKNDRSVVPYVTLTFEMSVTLVKGISYAISIIKRTVNGASVPNDDVTLIIKTINSKNTKKKKGLEFQIREDKRLV